MGKEVKIGLAIIFVLLLALGVVVYRQLYTRSSAGATAKQTDSGGAAEGAAAKSAAAVSESRADQKTAAPADRTSRASDMMDRVSMQTGRRRAAAEGEPTPAAPRTAQAAAATSEAVDRQRSQAETTSDNNAWGGTAWSTPDAVGQNEQSTAAAPRRGDPFAGDAGQPSPDEFAGDGDELAGGPHDTYAQTDEAAGGEAGSDDGDWDSSDPYAVAAPEGDPIDAPLQPGAAASRPQAFEAQSQADPWAGRGATSRRAPKQAYDGDSHSAADYEATYQHSAQPARFEAPSAVSAAVGHSEDWHQGQAIDSPTYRVAPHDTFWSISKQLYGSGAYAKVLHHHNRDLYPRADQLRAGDVIETPTVEELAARYPQLFPRRPAAAADSHPGARTRPASVTRQQLPGTRAYVVEEGDTLFDIARYELGKASRWSEIYDLNRDQIGQDFDRLEPGTTLYLPDEGSDSRTTQPRQPLRR